MERRKEGVKQFCERDGIRMLEDAVNHIHANTTIDNASNELFEPLLIHFFKEFRWKKCPQFGLIQDLIASDGMVYEHGLRFIINYLYFIMQDTYFVKI